MEEWGKAQSPFDAPGKIYEFLKERAQSEEQEVLYVLTLDSKLRLTGCTEVSRGLINQTLVHPREVFRLAVMLNAAHIVLAHNHPSGDPKPSPDDIRSTREIQEAGEVLGIPLLDHVIIGRPMAANRHGFTSLKQTGIFS